MRKSTLFIALLTMSMLVIGCTSTPTSVAPAKSDGAIVIRSVGLEGEEGKPMEAGKAAALALKKAMGATPLKAVIITECLEGKEMKKKVLAGVTSVIDKNIVYGGSTYGAYTQSGAIDMDAVSLMGIGGDGISVETALVNKMGAAGLTLEKDKEKLTKALKNGGKALAKQLPRSKCDQLMIVIADAHSPKNALFVEGIQEIMGKKFPLTGGSVNKNSGQTFVYYRGGMYSDSAVALLLSGNFKVAMAGRKAKTNDLVVSTAKDAADEASRKLGCKPMAMIAFDCAGRKGKLKKLDDELASIQKSVGKQIPLFGCYCAGEVGPADVSEKKGDVLSSGNGWHIMVTLIGR